MIEIDRLARIFGGFAHPVRVTILELLDDRGLRVCEIAAQLGTSQPHTSNHLALMRACGLVRARRDHRYVYYRVADPRVTRLLALGQSLARDRARTGTTASPAASRRTPRSMSATAG